MTDTSAISAEMRRIVIERSYPVRAGHVGSCLSVVDLLAVTFGAVLRRNSSQPDRFILSKGHAALALYAALYCTGELGEADLESYCADGSALGEHPDHVLPGIEFSSGSLGFGLSLGAGLALSARRRQSGQRSFVLMSDAELNEGSVWEAAMFAAHHELANLVLIIDLNGQQALGYAKDVLDLTRMADRWDAFGWDVHEVDGHDHERLTSVLSSLEYASGAPHVVLASTTFGRGVSFMEHELGWHYWSMNAAQYEDALMDLREVHVRAS